MKINFYSFSYFLILLLFNNNLVQCQNLSTEHFEGFFLSQERYPSGASSLDWFPDDWEIQGVTNDGNNWFFTIVDQDETQGTIWKIPKEVPLNGNVSNYPGVKSINFHDVDVEELKEMNAWHWGDLDYYNYNGIGYILVPIYSVLACFRADNLTYVNYADFDENASGGWCAIGEDGNLYASVNNPSAISSYNVDWDNLLFTSNNNALQFMQTYPLFKSDGSVLEMTDMQGGEFSETGEILYLVSGRGACLEWLGIPGTPWSLKDGIHAIETKNWTEIDHSIESADTTVYFSYEYDPTCIICWSGGGTDTPEGLTIWNLDDGSAPGIQGTLHVLVDTYLYGTIFCDDEMSFHHFSSLVYVDYNSPVGTSRWGTKEKPFKNISSSFDYYPIWDGATISIQTGTYNETGLFNKRVRLVSRNGPVVIGKQ